MAATTTTTSAAPVPDRASEWEKCITGVRRQSILPDRVWTAVQLAIIAISDKIASGTIFPSSARHKRGFTWTSNNRHVYVDPAELGRGTDKIVCLGGVIEEVRLVAHALVSITSNDKWERVQREIDFHRLVEDYDCFVRVLGHFSSSDTIHIDYEYMPLGSLSQYTDENTLSEKEIRTIIRALLFALSVLHGLGILHRDVKYDNILLTRNCKGELVPKLTDFGLSARFEGITQSDGSPLNFHPELCKFNLAKLVSQYGNPIYDIWAAGLVLYKMRHDNEELPLLVNYEKLANAIGTQPITPEERFARVTRNFYQSMEKVSQADFDQYFPRREEENEWDSLNSRLLQVVANRTIPTVEAIEWIGKHGDTASLIATQRRNLSDIRCKAYLPDLNRVTVSSWNRTPLYSVNQLLGNGNDKRVFLAFCAVLKIPVAHGVTHAKNQPRIAKEIRLNYECAGSENIVQLLGAVKVNGFYHLSFEYMNAGNLEDYVKNNPVRTVSTIVSIFKQAMQGVQALHALGIHHRDLKTGNIFIRLGPDGKIEVKIGDLGYSTHFDDKEGYRRTPGTPLYYHPSQLKYPYLKHALSEKEWMSKIANPKFDVWAMGHVLHELVYGRCIDFIDKFGGTRSDKNFTDNLSKVTQADIIKSFSEKRSDLDELNLKMMNTDENAQLSVEQVLDELEKIS